MEQSKRERLYRMVGGISGIVGVTLLGISFAINEGPPANATNEQLLEFGRQQFAHILWGAWMQAVGPALILLFAFALVHLAGAETRLSGWMTMFGAAVLMTTSLIEITFYIAALHGEPAAMPNISLVVISAVQHLYFLVAAPALFLPLGIVLVNSRILPRLFGYLAILLAAAFGALGLAFLYVLTLPSPVTAFAAVQAVWWLAAAITVLVKTGNRTSAVPHPA